MSRLSRILAVTAGLAASGALVGAVCAIGALLVIGGIDEGARVFTDPYAYLYGGEVGGVIGAVGGPAIGFGLLRHVPLGRAIAWTAIGAFAGGVLGFYVPSLGPLLGALAGFGTAAITVRLATPSTSRLGGGSDAPMLD